MKLKGTAVIFMPLCIAAIASIGAVQASAQQVRRISYSEYRDKVYAAWLGQVTGAAYGFPFEGKARNAIQLDQLLCPAIRRREIDACRVDAASRIQIREFVDQLLRVVDPRLCLGKAVDRGCTARGREHEVASGPPAQRLQQVDRNRR